MNASSIMGE